MKSLLRTKNYSLVLAEKFPHANDAKSDSAASSPNNSDFFSAFPRRVFGFSDIQQNPQLVIENEIKTALAIPLPIVKLPEINGASL